MGTPGFSPFFPPYLALPEPLPDEDDDGAALLVVAGRAVQAGGLLDRAQVLLPRAPQQLLETAMEAISQRGGAQQHSYAGTGLRCVCHL